MGLINNMNADTNDFDYYIASEGSSIEGMGYVNLEVPEGKYAVFTAVGPLQIQSR